jgi:N-acetylglutamate synthase-like GNAT family acetyltransferase
MSDDFDELRWVRVFSPIHIPKYLVEHVKDRDYSVEDFYKYQEINCLVQGKDGPTLNPFNHLYVLADEENIVQGFLWFVIDPLSKDAVINTFSVDKKYWHQGKAFKRVSSHVKEIVEKLKLKKVYWVTNYPKHSERHGFVRSKSVLMEYVGEGNGEDTTRRQKPAKKHKHVRPSAETAVEPSTAASGSKLS